MAETPLNAARFTGRQTIRYWQRLLNDLEAFYGDEAMLKIANTYAVDITGRFSENSVVPAITGTLEVGDTLTVSNGTWSPTPSGYTYEWFNENDESLGTGSTYVLTEDEVDLDVYAVVTANLNGYPASAEAVAVGPVTTPA